MKLPFWPRPSTRAFMAEARRTANYSFFDWLHGYIYARWPYFYIGVGTNEHPLARLVTPVATWVLEWLGVDSSASSPSGQSVTFADTYHGKVVPPHAARQLVMVQQDITLTNLEHIIPYARARDIILRQPDHIVVLECPCRAGRANPCQPLDVCLIIGEPLAGFVLEHHPRRARQITRDEAESILQAEHERGHVHHAFFKDAMLGRFYAICNCCACCCGAMQAQRNGVPMLAASGYVCQIDESLCQGCGTCASFCQFEALDVNGYATVDTERCMGCGVCVSKCEQGAISLVRDPARGEPLEIESLLAKN